VANLLPLSSRCLLTTVTWLLAAGLLLAILTCALAPSSNMREMWWIPQWLGEWADKNPNFRNMPVFAAFTFVLFFVWSSFRPSNRTSEAPKHCLVRLAFGVFVATALLGILLEVLQLLLPNRWADWRDVCWSVSGAFAGALAAYFISGILAPNSKRSAG